MLIILRVLGINNIEYTLNKSYEKQHHPSAAHTWAFCSHRTVEFKDVNAIAPARGFLLVKNSQYAIIVVRRFI